MKDNENLKDNRIFMKGMDRADRARTKKIAQVVRRRLILLIILLIVIVLALSFRIGEAFWPDWLSGSRILLRGILLFILIFLIPAAPVIIEASSSPRVLTGPGKNPRWWR